MLVRDEERDESCLIGISASFYSFSFRLSEHIRFPELCGTETPRSIKS